MKRIIKQYPLTVCQPRKTVVKRIPSRASWATIGAERIYFRSTWEKKYAYYLEWLKNHRQIAAWQHEPHTFWFEKIKRGVRSYLPDFKVTRMDGCHHWVEVKGFMDARSKTKLKRFAKYYPNETMYIVDADWFKDNDNILRMIPGCFQKRVLRKPPGKSTISAAEYQRAIKKVKRIPKE